MKPSWNQSFMAWKRRKLESFTSWLSGLRGKKHAVSEREEAQEYEQLPSWQELLVEFVNRTTWHGLKYISIPSRFLLRRIIWIAILISNAVLFIFIMTQRKDYLMTHPSSIAVVVSYNDVLPFSAITVCNHNPYRLTAMQELGLYDLMVNDLGKAGDLDNGCGYFERFPGICRLPREFLGDAARPTVQLNETTRDVCMTVCREAYDWTCSGVFYYRQSRTCYLTPYTGEWLEDDQPPCDGADGVEFYRRHRCTYTGEIFCNFEDNACTFTDASGYRDRWHVVQAADSYVRMDNTLDLGSGHVANLLLTELRPGYRARYVSDYMNTTGQCLELFYWLAVDDPTTDESATLSVIVVTEERTETVVLPKSRGPMDWSREYVRLPEGVHQVVIEGKRGSVGQSGICLDDITVKDCSKFDVSHNCKVTRRGRAYLGTINVTATGEPCLPWESIDNPLLNSLPDPNPADAENYCRNVPQQNWNEPSCYVKLKSLAIRPMPCDIPYCECHSSSYFKCDSGMCIPRNFICNGEDDCLDGSDELGICNTSRSIECYFDNDYKCGYESNNVGALRFLRLSASNLRYYYGSNIISVNVSALEQLMLVDSKLGQMGDQVQLVSPLWTFNNATVLRITYIMMGSTQPPDSNAGLYLYQYSELHVPVRRLFSATSFTERDLLEQDVCVPSGTYHLMFLGVQGVPYESDFALDIVKIVGSCNFKEEHLDDSFDCNFMTMCGYRSISSSALFTWTLIYTNNAFKKSTDVCSAEFGGVEGIITSPGYPNNYDNDMLCNFSIIAPPGVTIEITFLEFSLEPESDCLFDRLEITDPFGNITKVYCGNVGVPPVFHSKGNILYFMFITDESVNNGRFKLEYKTPLDKPLGTDFALSLRYSGLRSAKDLVHVAKLISPTVTIIEDSCVTVMLMSASNFTIKMAYLLNQVYAERLLLSSPQPLGSRWQKLHLSLFPSMSDSNKFVLVLEMSAAAPGTDAAIINDVRMLNGSCRDTVTNGTIACHFDDIDQCGYLDVSKNSQKWLRTYDATSDLFYMQSYFDRAKPVEAVLQSVKLEITEESCVKVTYFSSSQDLNIRIESVPSSFLLRTRANASSPGQLTYGNAYVQQDLPIGEYSIALLGFLQGDNSVSGAMEQMKIYSIDVSKGNCIVNMTVDNSFCTFDNPNLCGYAINYPFGAPWKWTKFDGTDNPKQNPSNLSSKSCHDNVMMYNSSSYSLKGILLSSNVSKQDSTWMIFDAYASSVKGSVIEVYTKSLQYSSFRQLSVEGQLVAKQWATLRACLPAGAFRIMFVATVYPIDFVAVDNINQSNVPCSQSHPVVSQCFDSDRMDCIENHFSWSPQFAWRYTSDIRNDTVMPGGDGCFDVFYETEGVIDFNKVGKQYMEDTICGLYIKGLTAFTIEMFFEKFEYANCSSQYLEVWTDNGSDFTNGNKTWCQNVGNTSLVFTTDKVIQIKVFVSNQLPRFRLRYKYIPDTMSGLFLALHYIGSKESDNYTINRVAQWTSTTLFPTGGRVCVDFDMAIQSGLLEVVLAEKDPDSGLVVSTTVFTGKGIKTDHFDWSHGTFEVPLETNGVNGVYLIFYFSITNATFTSNSETFVGALKDVQFYEGSCPNNGGSSASLFSLCQFSQNQTCGFRDKSQDSSRWILQSFRAAYSLTGDCKVSHDGREYVGNISNTISGRRCQRWDQQMPHAHNQDFVDYFPDLQLKDAADHCRNPSNPFIVRSSWCYTMDPRQRREYCDIPFCLDYVMQAELLASQANRAVLVSAPLKLSGSSCLEFRYRLTSTVVKLMVKFITNVTTIPYVLSTFSIPAETLAHVWVDGSVDLPSNATQIYFAADKPDVTNLDQRVSLYNISIAEGPCTNRSSNGNTPASGNNHVPYTGQRLRKDSYMILVLEEFNDTSMQVLTSKMAHQQNQLFYKCDYGQSPCNASDFLTEFTDMGQCYTFNYDPNNFHKAFTTGAESGARFILNVEQYEHVKGYVSGVGIKMQLHDQADISRMRDLGVAAMPGVHNLATISYINIESLTPPFGFCGSTDLPYFSSGDEPATYTETKCRMESTTRFVEQKCGCKNIYMPGPSPVCTLDQTIQCIKTFAEASLNVSSSAVCPPACSVNSFGVGLSQSQLSGLDIDELLSNKTEELQEHYVRALEIRHRVDEGIMTATITSMESLISNHNNLKEYIYFAVLDLATSIPRHIDTALQSISQLVFSDIVTGGSVLLSKFETAYLVNVKPRESYLGESLTSLHARLSLSKDLLKDLQDDVDSSWYAQIFHETVSDLVEFHNILTIHARNANTTDDYRPKIFTFPPCETYQSLIMASIPNLTILFENFTDVRNDSKICDTIVDEVDEMLMYLSNLSVCNFKYSSFLQEFRGWLGSLKFDFKEFSVAINSEEVLNLFMHNSDWLTALKRNYSQNAISKLTLADRLLSGTSLDMKQKIDKVIQDINQQVVAPLQNKISTTEEDIVVMYVNFLANLVTLENYTLGSEVEEYARSLKIWRKPNPDLEVPQVLGFKLSDSETWQVWPSEKKLQAFVDGSAKDRLTLVSVVFFSELSRQLSTFLSTTKSSQDRFLASLDAVMVTLREYNDTSKINDKFVMQNFLMLDIYYGEMKYEHISQSEAYTWTNFFSELGSYFGLLMGCSLLTMIEVLDLVIYYSIVKVIERYQTNSPRMEVIEINNIESAPK